MPSKTPIWFAFYIEDWLNGTDDLSAEESGVYLRMIIRMYQRGGFLRDDDRRNAMDCNLSTRRFRTIKNKLLEDGKLTSENAGLTNDRVQKELKKRAKISEKKSQNAKSKTPKHNENSPENRETEETNAEHMHSYTRASSHRLTEETQSNQQTQSRSDNQKNTESQNAREFLFEDLPIDDCGRMGFCGKVVSLSIDDVNDLKKVYPKILDITGFIRQFDANMNDRKRRGISYDGWRGWLETNLYQENIKQLESQQENGNYEMIPGTRTRVNRG